MRILNALDVTRCLPMDEAIQAMQGAFAALSQGKAHVPLRSHLEVPNQEAVNLFMPAYLEGDSEDSLAIKIVGVYPKNPSRGLPMIHAAVVVIDAETGATAAMLEGGALTAIRTGAGSGAATALSTPASRTTCRSGSTPIGRAPHPSTRDPGFPSGWCTRSRTPPGQAPCDVS